jgi:hypothetical protein
MALTRRAFLRKTSLVLAGLSGSELFLGRYGSQYHQVLAQPTGRKLALLVGINQYQDLGKKIKLKGCLTDLELQKELLVHRFGVHPDDIVMLKDQQATLTNIETAFAAHLIEQARPQDSVMFHFSGFGCLVDHGNPMTPAGVGSAPSPSNVLIPFGYRGDSDGESLLDQVLWPDQLSHWFASLNTQQSLCVLDAGFTYPGTALLGNLRVRSLPTLFPATRLPNADEQQEKLLKPPPRRPIHPELTLAASQPSQTAIEAPMRDFSAGLFTYALTQQLWQMTASTKFSVSFHRLVSMVEAEVGRVQQPFFQGAGNGNTLQTDGLFLGEGTDGVVTDLEDSGGVVTVWLGGVLPQVLDSYEATTCFKVVPNHTPVANVQPGQGNGSTLSTPALSRDQSKDLFIYLDSHQGCAGTGHCSQEGRLHPGQRIQEAFRVMSRTVILNVALGSQLNRIERVDATSAFSDMANIHPVNAGEQHADCLFTQVSLSSPAIAHSTPSESLEESQTSPSPQIRYGLFSQGGEELADTRVEAGEAIKTAVNQLYDTLKLLLARKTLALSVNDFSSRIGATVVLEAVEADKTLPLSHQSTVRSPWPLRENLSSLSIFEKQGEIVQLSKGQHIQYRIQNDSDVSLYWLVLGMDNRTQFFTIYSPGALLAVPDPETASEDTVAPGLSLTVPAAMNDYMIREPAGLATTYVILSRFPFVKGLAAIASQVRPSVSNTAPVVVRLPNPLEVTQQVLQDLHEGSLRTAQQMGIATDNHWVLDVDQWATFQFTHEVI